MQKLEQDLNKNCIKVLKILDEISALVLNKGIKLNKATNESINNYQTIEEFKQIEIINSLQTYCNTLSNVKELHLEFPEMDLITEENCLRSALKEFNLKMIDDDFSFIEKDNIVEIYNDKAIQLWRNFQLLKLNPYDLLTVLTHEWFVLYERATKITDHISRRAQEVLTNNNINGLVPLDIPIHTMKAVSAHDQVVVSVNFKFMKPVFHKRTNKKVGFIITSENTPELLCGEETNIITHI